MVIVMISVLLAIVLGLTSIIIGGANIAQSLGYSVKSFHAADTGMEKALYNVKNSACSNFSGNIDADTTYTVVFNGDCSAGTTVDSTGQYKTTKRKLEVALGSSGGGTSFVCGSTITDIDSNIYNTVSIGSQCWMKENLMTTKYADGTSITRGPTGATWDGTDHGYYAYPPNTSNNAEETLGNITTNKLGFVYQWSATQSSHSLCPTGWHVPTDAEQYTLENYLTDNGQTCNASRNGTWDCSSAGSKLSTFTLNGNNSSGFTAVLSGSRLSGGSFYDRATNARFWSSSVSGYSAWHRYLGSGYATVSRFLYDQVDGLSVRCLKN